MRLRPSSVILAAICFLSSPITSPAAPGVLNHQGRIAVSGVNFDGTGHFKFALVDAAGTNSFWSNDGTSAGGAEPAAALAVAVLKGHYAVTLGETIPIPAGVFTGNDDVRLRVWFSQSGTGGSFELLTPDRRVASAGFALSAASVGGVLTTTESGEVVIGVSGTVPLQPLVPIVNSSQGSGIDLALSDGNLFLAGDRLRIYDVSDPENLIFNVSNNTLPGAKAVAAVGAFAYLSDGTTFQCFELTSPTTIAPRDSIALSNPIPTAPRHKVLIKGDTAYENPSHRPPSVGHGGARAACDQPQLHPAPWRSWPRRWSGAERRRHGDRRPLHRRRGVRCRDGRHAAGERRIHRPAL